MCVENNCLLYILSAGVVNVMRRPLKSIIAAADKPSVV